MNAAYRGDGKLLVVDDIAENRNLLSRYFGARGFRIAQADCGRTALSMIKQQHFDAVLLDIIMPEIDGIEVLKTIRASHTPAGLPVIMVSGRSASNDIKLVLDLGANDYITKPIDLAAALTKLQRALGAVPGEQANPQVPAMAGADPVDKASARPPGAGGLQGVGTQFRKGGNAAYAEQLTAKASQHGSAAAGNFRNRADLRRKPRRQFQCNAWIIVDQQVPSIKCTIADVSELGTRVVLQSEQDLPNHFILLFTENGSARRSCRLVWQTGLNVGIEFTSGLAES